MLRNSISIETYQVVGGQIAVLRLNKGASVTLAPVAFIPNAKRLGSLIPTSEAHCFSCYEYLILAVHRRWIYF